ncbi:MAG TPA: choice-of-anchor tandem repeat GloVer-containing protein [Candidatus Cybelea sp.]|nr:choice-of-anchor tandem repeat GloVer-containing protein [Candidatus Cybelea sp.]
MLGTFAAAAMLSGCGGGSGTPLSPLPAGVTAERMHSPGYSVLYSFKGGSDGAFPSAGLANVNGTLYGTTSDGGPGCNGSLGCGTVYAISPSGGETVLYAFKGGSADGANPVASLLDVNGTLYGTTAGGGASGYGTVFSITRSGSETVLHRFKGGSRDGAHPLAPLLEVDGMLYGTTSNGGAYCRGSGGCGTVFSIATSGKETLLYSFKGGKIDGQNPYAGLIDAEGKLYGTTNWAGANCKNGLACGTVFEITRSGKETMRYSFKGGADGQNPQAALIDVNDKLYGTVTGYGAYCRCGTVFAVTPSGTETVLHSFGKGHDGELPQAPLLGMNGKLYGTTEYGGSGSHGAGTVFELSTSGNERVLHSFNGDPDGAYPIAGLINVNGTLYGTAQVGGSVYCTASGYLGCGVVFALKP